MIAHDSNQTSSEPIAVFEHRVSKHQMEKFFKAVAWQTTPFPSCPPTLATVFRHGEFKALEALNIPLRNVLHAEQGYRFHRDLEPDKVFKGKTLLKSRHEKSGRSGSMVFLVLQTNLEDDHSTLFVECLTTIAVRNNTGEQ